MLFISLSTNQTVAKEAMTKYTIERVCHDDQAILFSG
jgi:hypothetical protein